MTTRELPEPLRTAVDGVARLMATGASGTCGKGGELQPYRRLAKQHSNDLLAALRAGVEAAAADRTVREADESLYRVPLHRSVLLGLVVCDASRPERPVSILRSTDCLYAVTAINGDSLGLVVALAMPALRLQQ